MLCPVPPKFSSTVEIGEETGLAASLLVNVDDLIAFRARVIGVFEKLDEEGNQTAA